MIELIEYSLYKRLLQYLLENMHGSSRKMCIIQTNSGQESQAWVKMLRVSIIKACTTSSYPEYIYIICKGRIQKGYKSEYRPTSTTLCQRRLGGGTGWLFEVGGGGTSPTFEGLGARAPQSPGSAPVCTKSTLIYFKKHVALNLHFFVIDFFVIEYRVQNIYKLTIFEL